METHLLMIGQLAKGAGVKPDTVRFYEKQGLMAKPARTAAGYRAYDEAALKQLRFIKRAQSLGFTLPEIKRILNLRGQGAPTCRRVIAMTEATLSETESKLNEIQRFADGLRQNLARWRKASGGGKKMVAEF